eukprot:627459-Amphidinium_carterae.1
MASRDVTLSHRSLESLLRTHNLVKGTSHMIHIMSRSKGTSKSKHRSKMLLQFSFTSCVRLVSESGFQHQMEQAVRPCL